MVFPILRMTEIGCSHTLLRLCVAGCEVYTTIDFILHIVFIFLPILWLCGVLPPLDALMSWSLEQFLIHALGGSHMASDMR